MMDLTNELRSRLLGFQKNEITEYHIYKRLARKIKSPENSKILADIAEDELRHYNEWKEFTHSDVKPNWLQIWFYYLISRFLGFTFGLKLMERGEEGAQEVYGEVARLIPEAQSIIKDENIHEEALLGMLDEELLQYTGSMVLGLNDALVELTGALAGFTLALQDTGLIALTGSITGVAASLSMAASEYLATKSEESGKDPIRASVYTGIAYILTVIVLIFPYLLFSNIYICLGLTLVLAIMIIAFFNYYISVAKDEPFKNRFFEMAGLSMGVAVFSFLIGFVLRAFLGVDN
jgi:VIT1/CCC1 family predicted Fe2+/Mn2+ transporter